MIEMEIIVYSSESFRTHLIIHKKNYLAKLEEYLVFSRYEDTTAKFTIYTEVYWEERRNARNNQEIMQNLDDSCHQSMIVMIGQEEEKKESMTRERESHTIRSSSSLKMNENFSDLRIKHHTLTTAAF